MSRIDLLEETAAKGRLMREMQKAYFESRKGAGPYPSKDSRKILNESKVLEGEFDELLKQLDVNDEEL